MASSVNGLDSESSLQVAYELMKRSKALTRKKKKRSLADVAAEKQEARLVESQTAAQEALQKAGQTAPVQAADGTSGTNVRINLGDLFARLKQLQDDPEAARKATEQGQQKMQLSMERRTTEVEISLNVNRQVNGIERINQNLAQTDRYLFEFQDGATFVIKDKWSGRSTTVWGDPHVDVDDVEGANNGDFKDLTGSDRVTTFMLQDGTRLTFTALDAGVIEKVDIFKDGQHLQGTGMGSQDWQQDGKQLFDTQVKSGDGYESSLERGDVVKAGGDGNDWFNEAGQLVWGQTTGPLVYSRPSLSLEVKVRQTIEQFSFVQQIDKKV